MPGVTARRRSVRPRRSPARRRRAATGQIVASEMKPVRGLKMKTVSWLMMLFALVCLGAFLAGRSSATGRNSTNPVRAEPSPVLRPLRNAPAEVTTRRAPRDGRVT